LFQQGQFGPKFQLKGVGPTKHSYCQKTRINNLICGKECGHKFLSFCHNPRVLHTQIDRRTERLWQYRALHYMQSHGKNELDFQASVQYDVRVSVQDSTRQKYPGYAAQISWKKWPREISHPDEFNYRFWIYR